MAEPFIKLYRKMLKWEWYDDSNTFKLFIHFLLKANWKKGYWHGLEIQPGQFVTSLPKISKETGLSMRQARTALDHLKATGEVTDKTFSKFRIITVLKWDEYQVSDMQNADKRQANDTQNDRQTTTIEEYKEIKNKRNIYSAPKTAAEKSGGNTTKYSHEFFEELERQAALNPWGIIGNDDEDY